jgi:DNA mismatch repair ATPase MutS
MKKNQEKKSINRKNRTKNKRMSINIDELYMIKLVNDISKEFVKKLDRFRQNLNQLKEEFNKYLIEQQTSLSCDSLQLHIGVNI